MAKEEDKTFLWWLTFFLSECGECECVRARPQETEKRRPRRGRKEKGDVIKIDVCVEKKSTGLEKKIVMCTCHTCEM